MKTLLESILLELKLSKASTGKKLDLGLTFGELKEGDKIYVCFYKNRPLEDIEYEVIKLEHHPNPGFRNFKTDKNPDKEEPVYCVLGLSLKNTKNDERAKIAVPTDVRYLSTEFQYAYQFVVATNYNVFLDCVEKNKLLKV